MMYQQKSKSLGQGARQGFVQKVYTIISIQLAVTVLTIILNMTVPTFAYIQASYSSLSWLAIIVTLGSMLALFFNPKYATTYPINMVLLGLFTLGESFLVASICSMYTPQTVLLAGIATLSATLGITYYAMTTKQDWTSKNSITAFAFSAMSILFWVSLVNIMFVRSSFVSMGLAYVLGIIYSIYLLVDTQLILGGKHKSLSLDNYVLGAIIIYADIISLFLQLLKILGKKKQQ